MSIANRLLQDIRNKQVEIVELKDELFLAQQELIKADLEIEREVLLSPDLKNENQRKFRRMELKTEDEYEAILLNVKSYQRSIDLAQIDLEMLQNELNLLLK